MSTKVIVIVTYLLVGFLFWLTGWPAGLILSVPVMSVGGSFYKGLKTLKLWKTFKI